MIDRALSRINALQWRPDRFFEDQKFLSYFNPFGSGMLFLDTPAPVLTCLDIRLAPVHG
jgi:hypothetical protein